MKLPTIPYLADAFIAVLHRFPLVMLAAFSGTIATMVYIENENDPGSDGYVKVILTCMLGLVGLLCAKLVVEKWRLAMPKAILPNFLVIALLAWYYLDLHRDGDIDSMVTPVQFLGLNLVAHLGVAFIPFLDASPVEDFWEYNKRLFGNFMVGSFYSLVLFAGLGIAIFAVDELFNLEIRGEVYAHLFIVIAGIFNTVYFLAHFPRDFSFQTEQVEGTAPIQAGHYTTSFKNLTKFILIPIVTIYFMILYAFSAKILVTWELPQGWVGKLVLGFSVAGIFTYLLNYLLVKYDNSMAVNGYRRWFFHVLLPMVALLFVSIGRRINDYGVTEPRYVVATAGVWLLLLSVYFLISKKDNIKFIPISLAFFSLITVVGPFNAFKVSERNQIGRLEAIFTKNNMLKEGKLVPATDSLGQTDLEQIRSTIIYLRENDHFEQVAPWFGLAKDSLPDWQATEQLLQKIGVNPGSATDYVPTCYVYFDSKGQQGTDASGFQQFYQVNAYKRNKPENGFTGFLVSQGNNGLQLFENGEQLDSFNLQVILDKLEANGACSGKQMPDSLGIYETSSGKFQLKLLLDNVTIRNGVPVELVELNGKALVGKKQ